MVVSNYGVWVGRILRYEAETDAIDNKSPHIHLFFDDGQGRQEKAAINVKSIGKESQLVYWVAKDFQHPLTETLRSLDMGFHLAEDDESGALGLDFYRTEPALLSLKRGRVLPHDIPGPDNDVLDQMRPILDKAVGSQATVFVFGSMFNDRKAQGVHDVHMNQGSLPRFDNGVYQDGALFLYFSDEDRFQAVFLAFASQKLPTSDDGLALDDSVSLKDLVTPNEDGRAARL